MESEVADEDKLGFLSEGEDAQPAEPVETAPEPEESAEAPEQAAPEVTGEKEVAPPATVQDDQGRFVPVTALLDERDKRKAAEQRAAALEQWRQEQERKAQEKQPDFYEDPDKAFGFMRDQFEQRLFNERLNISEAMARQSHGDDVVAEAQQAFAAAMQRDPGLMQKLQNETNPYGFVVNWHKQQRFLSEVKDPDTWREQERERIRQEIMAEIQSPRPKSPPQSLASAPSAAGNDAPPSPGGTFDQMFPR